jgi:predicted DNA-binding transcriptional regulator AlpA
MRLLSWNDLREKKGVHLSRSQINRLIKAGRWPRPIHPGGPGGRPAFIESEIDEHIPQLIAERDDRKAA